MFDHVSLVVTDFARSLAFYRAALAPLGLEAQHVDERAKSAGFGPPGSVGLWLAEGVAGGPVHLALQSSHRAAVRAFHEAALLAGGKDNGAPGPRPDYGEAYYAAFVRDPDGNNVEALTFGGELATRPVYYIGTYDIDDAKAFSQYPPRVMALLPKYGGRVLASDTSAYAVEGSARTMNAIIRFPSKEAALGLYDDPDYQEAKRIRQGSTSHGTMVLASEIEPPKR